MSKLRMVIDGLPVEAEQDETILTVARRMGIEIPTLCHLDGLEPATACSLCLVSVDDHPKLIPSCGRRVEEGMTVTTSSEEIRRARRAALELLLSDHRGDCVAPCTLACPAGLDVPAFIARIEARDPHGSLEILRRHIPLPGALGRICPRYCEHACRRRLSEDAIAICALMRYPSDRQLEAGEPQVTACRESSGKSVAIVGAGPAGLSAAHTLLEAGHACTVFDAHREPGGMLRHAISAFRLPREALVMEIDVISRMGANLRMSTRLGEDITLDELRHQHDAVLLALGAQYEQPMLFPGVEHTLSAMTLLRDVAAGDHPHALGNATIVIGIGNETIDTARTALRLGSKTVTIVAGRRRKALPAFTEHLEAAMREGIELLDASQVVRLEREQSGHLRLEYERNGEIKYLEADTVLAAPVRSVDPDLGSRLGLPSGADGLLADRRSHRTDTEGVYAAGEVTTGAGAAVRAVGAGCNAAHAIDLYLRGEPPGETVPLNVFMGRLDDEERRQLLQEVPPTPRAGEPRSSVAAEGHLTFDEVELGFDEEAALNEAARCMQCDCRARDTCQLRDQAEAHEADPRAHPGECRPFRRDLTHPAITYESGKCILCGICVRITSQTPGEAPGLTFTVRGFGGRVEPPFSQTLASALTPEIARACADACPTGALALKLERPRGPAAATRSDREA